MNKIDYVTATYEEYGEALKGIKDLRKCVDYCEYLHKLSGKKYYDGYLMFDLGLIFADNVLSVDYGRTKPMDNNEEEYKFIYSKELSNYFKNVILSIVPDDMMTKKAHAALSSDKLINDMKEEDLKGIYSVLDRFYKTKESKEQPYVKGVLTTYLHKLDGKGVMSYIKHNISSFDLTKHILLTSGLSYRGSYYSGRGVRYGDLNQTHLKCIFLKLNKLDPDYGKGFVELVKAMPTLGATEFINSFKKFGNNGFVMNENVVEKSNTSLDGLHDEARDAVALISIMSVLSRGNDKDEQEQETRYIRNEFLDSIKFYIGTQEKDAQAGNAYSYSRKVR